MTYAIFTAILFGLGSYPAKHLAESGWNEYEIGWATFGIGLLPLIAVATALDLWSVRDGFWGYCLMAIAGNVLAVTAYYRAIRLTDLSIVLPLVSISPFFMLFTTRLLLGETTSVAGSVGVIFVVAGAYLLGCSRDRSSLVAPLRALIADTGARWALLVALVWSVTANIDKICLEASNSIAYPAIFSAGMTAAYSVILVIVRRGAGQRENSGQFSGIDRRRIRLTTLLSGIAVGAAYSTMLVAQFTALYFLAVPYVIAVKRAGLLAGVALGAVRGEKGIAWRTAGAAAVIAGIAIIAVKG